MIPKPKGPPWWRPFTRQRWRRAMELPPDIARRFAEIVRRNSLALELFVVGDCSATELALRDGRLVPRRGFELSVDADALTILAAGPPMLEHIARHLGRGRVWTLPGLEIVHPVYLDGSLVRLNERNRPFVLLRALYYHEATAFKPLPPEEKS